jgi:hypothetical protein
LCFDDRYCVVRSLSKIGKAFLCHIFAMIEDSQAQEWYEIEGKAKDKRRTTMQEPEIKIIRPGIHNRQRVAPELEGVERISKLLDSQFIIPGTNIRFGLDPIFSLFPVIGDFITYMISAALIYTMHTQGASRKVVIKMLLNSTFDAVLGAIPIVGTVFDVFYRSNEKNIRLLKEHYLEGKHEGSGNGLVLVIAIICLMVVCLTIYGMYKLIEAIF